MILHRIEPFLASLDLINYLQFCVKIIHSAADCWLREFTQKINPFPPFFTNKILYSKCILYYIYCIPSIVHFTVSEYNNITWNFCF
jgi:hypothetical protein